MSYIKVTSTQVHSLQFDPVDQDLSVRFNCLKCKGCGRSGTGACGTCRGEGHTGAYHYEAPEGTYEKLRDVAQAGNSVGHAVHELLKKPGYKFTFKPNRVTANA